MTIEELLGEPVEDARVRERGTFDQLAGDSDARLVLFGAGMRGRKICEALRRHGVVPLAFADNAADIIGNSVDGVPVLSPADAAARYGAEAVFVVTIFRGE